DELEDQFGGLKGLVRNEQGEVQHHVSTYVNSEAIEALQGLETTLRDGDEVSIIPALAGGGPALAGGGPALAGGGAGPPRGRRPARGGRRPCPRGRRACPRGRRACPRGRRACPRGRRTRAGGWTGL